MISIRYATPEGVSESRAPMMPELSRRQEEVWKLVCKGLPNKLIAYELGCALATVKVHVRALMQKTGARNRLALLRLAVEEGRA